MLTSADKKPSRTTKGAFPPIHCVQVATITRYEPAAIDSSSAPIHK